VLQRRHRNPLDAEGMLIVRVNSSAEEVATKIVDPELSA
jgi:hypothetical protein